MRAFNLILDGTVQNLGDALGEKYGNNVILQNATSNDPVSIGDAAAQPFNLVADADITLLSPPSGISVNGTNAQILHVLIS